MEREPTRPFRRKKKYQGATWTPERQPALYEDGLWCRPCKTRHGYMTMGLAYEKRGGTFIMLWSCKTTGNVIGETRLGGSSASAQEGNCSRDERDSTTSSDGLQGGGDQEA